MCQIWSLVLPGAVHPYPSDATGQLHWLKARDRTDFKLALLVLMVSREQHRRTLPTNLWASQQTLRFDVVYVTPVKNSDYASSALFRESWMHSPPEPVEGPPLPSPRSGGSRMLRGLMLRRVQIFWARAYVGLWRLTVVVLTTKKVARKLSANCCSSGKGAHLG